MKHPVSRRQFTLALLATGLNTTTGLAQAQAPAHTATTAPMTSPLDLTFDPARHPLKTVEVPSAPGSTVPTLSVRVFEALPVVSHPVEPQYQALNLYIPEAYFHGGTVGRYTAATAPIFLPNAVGGYMPALPGTLTQRMGPPPAPGQTPGSAPAAAPNASAQALARGMVVAAPGARGRTLRTTDGRWTGKAPAAIVDLKAAVRWLRFNADRLPGNTDRIISNGTSAGGALSALLGASGNHPDYAEALAQAGAAPGRDDLFAVSAYCPITNLEHADGAYEWQFYGLEEYRNIAISMLDYQVQRREVVGHLTPAQQTLSQTLRQEFVAYVNGLNLSGPDGQRLHLDGRGQGSLREHLKALVMASAQQALANGQTLAAYRWLSVEAGQVRDLDFDAYVRDIGRMKALPAFDGLALETGENQLFGDEHTDLRHFTAFAQQHSSIPGATQAGARAVRMMNAMAYIGAPQANTAPHWRLRHGTHDRDTSLAIPALLAAQLRQHGHEVDLALPWARPHSGDYDLGELFDWIERRVALGHA